MDLSLESIGKLLLTYGSWGGILSLTLYMYFTKGRRRAETKRVEVETEIRLSKQTIKVIDALQKEIERQQKEIEKQHEDIDSFRTRIELLESQLSVKDERINLLQTQIDAIAIQCPNCPLKSKFN